MLDQFGLLYRFVLFSVLWMRWSMSEVTDWRVLLQVSRLGCISPCRDSGGSLVYGLA